MENSLLMNSERWIWLPESLYPEYQSSIYSGQNYSDACNFAVAEFKKEYKFEKNVRSAYLRFSGDTLFRLYCNGALAATGPASVGGDFIGNETARDNYYSYETEIFPNADKMEFFAQVQLNPVQICDYSKGHGGFMLSATVVFDDGTQRIIHTDETWLSRINTAYTSPNHFDNSIDEDEYTASVVIDNIWHTDTAPIPVRVEEELHAENSSIKLIPGEKREDILYLDRIYAGFLKINAECNGEVRVRAVCRELEEDAEAELIKLSHSGEYRSFCLRSVGNIHVTCENLSDEPAVITVSVVSTCYPADKTATATTSDTELNRVLEVCRHTLKYCRQTHHLDSPKHCEPLACTGEYYIESLMTMFSFGDMRLSEFDILRTAELLVRHDGRMFHTTYSLIWVRMLYDVYMITGNVELLKKCKAALMLLLDKFESYIGENGLIETPPDFMFVDWIYIDEISMHHPPKALGQTCLNMYYYGALNAAASIFAELDCAAMQEACLAKACALRKAVNSQLFDVEKRMYFEGLNTPTPEELLYRYMPQNTDKRYYLKHSNILAACFGICDDELARELLHRVMSDEIEGDYQPYFAHFLLEAVFRCGLREKYTLKILERWKKPIGECSKGLVEGFIAPEPTYSFDHSHAWGGTPLYSLPRAVLGLEIVKPGLKELRLSPSLLGLEAATVELPTEYGMVVCALEKGKEPVIKHPKEVKITTV